MRCGKCGEENREAARFCVNCGARLVLVCPQCGIELPTSARFCDGCGAQVGLPPTEAEAEPTVAQAIPERIRRLVPAEYADRLLRAAEHVSGERRMVTILCSDVQGSTAMAEQLDPEDVMEIMDGAFDVLIEPIYRHEGTLARLMGDAILAFFGAPIAHEDDPERACHAALEIVKGAQAHAEELARDRGIQGFNVRVGINTGLVVVGEVGSDLRVEYTAMGDAINLAARMEQNAPPGSILITHDTYRHVRGVFDVLRQEPLAVKGRREPVRTYRLQRAKPRAFRKGVRGVEGIETIMVGRQAELTLLQEAFYTAIEDRELQMTTIVGDAGVGKSRLLHEFDIWAEALAQQYFFFKGRALQEMQRLPYALIRDLFAFRFQIEESDAVDDVRRKLEEGVAAALGGGPETPLAPGAALRAAHFIGHLAGFALGESAHLEHVLDDPRQARDRALEYLTDYFEALAARNPVLILLEDLHWADDSSLDVLNHLALALTDQPLMIVGAARPALFEGRPHWGEGQPFHTRLNLRPLTKRNTRQLLGEILQKVGDVPQTLSDLVVAGAEGNPFFVEELVKMLVEDGVIVKGEEHWRVEPARLGDVRVPPTLTGVLQARLDRLPLEDRTVLQQASVVGRLFWDRAVLRISESAAEGVDEGDVLDALSALRGREMVFQRETTAFAGAQEYLFKHNVLREVTYESLLKRLRRVYHGLVADWLIDQSGERVGEHTGLIADHLELAGRSEEAIDYLLEAGDRARRLYAHQEAITAYERALALLKEQGDQERAARTLMKLGLTHHTALEFRRSRDAYDEAFSLWQGVAGKEQLDALPAAPHALRLSFMEPMTLDPSKAFDETSVAIILQLFWGLVEVNTQLDVLPGLARDWAVTEDGRRYEFHLPQDALWSDGEPVTAADVVCMTRRMLHPIEGSDLAGALYCIKGARAYHQGEVSSPESVGLHAVDRYRLVMELEEPTAYALHLLAHAVPVPRHTIQIHGDAWAETGHIVTNGPFRLESWRRGVSMTLKRSPDHPGRARGNVHRVELHFLPRDDSAAQLEMYEADELDIADVTDFPPATLDVARRRHSGEHVSTPVLSTLGMAFNAGRSPFDDPRVRQALAMGIDRETLSSIVLAGTQYPATGGLVPPGMPGHSPGIGLRHDVSHAQ
ncbi:MAG: ABC transporter substrate-binding protein, partial [Anaerolineae bacterium]